MTRTDEDERLALFLDYENLAIGARESLGIAPFDMDPVADALAVRGRVLARRAYADWSFFDEDRRRLTRHHVELIEITQRMGVSGRKNAADIKMAVDAIELAFERPYVTTFVIATGDSDFSPLVDKLRELDRRVIGLGVRDSTSALLPNACDEFIFYDDLIPDQDRRNNDRRSAGADRRRRSETAQVNAGQENASPPPEPTEAASESAAIDDIVLPTLAGLGRSTAGPVRASSLKRAILRKDPTFSEGDHGFRAFGELLRHLESRGLVELDGKGDPEVGISESSDDADSFDLLARVVAERGGSGVSLSGLKDEMRKHKPDFDEGQHGYRSFLQFCRGAAQRDVVELTTDGDSGEHFVSSSRPT